MDDGDDARPTITFAKKRNRQKAGGLTAASSAASSSTSSARHTPARDLGDDDEEDGGGVVVKTATRRRGAGGASGVASTSGARRGPPSSASRLSSRTTLLAADGEGDGEEIFAASSSAIKAPRSGLALPSNLDQASIAAQTESSLPIASSSSSHYSAQALADLRAASSRRLDNRNGDGDGEATIGIDEYGHPITSDLSSAPTAFKTLDDPTAASTGHDSAAFFGSEHLDGASGSMPSQAVIEAAKEQRRRRAAAAAEGAGGSEDFVSLNDQGPPSSRSVVRHEDRLDRRRDRDDGTVPSLRREEDEEGSGEDEFADFTGAQDRITLDAAKRQKEVERQRREEAAESSGGDDEDDDDDDEFERVQLRRMGTALRQEREQNQRDAPARRQHKSAPLPAITPLPGPSAARLRLEARLSTLQETQSSHEALVSQSTSTLSTLAADEETNKSSVTAWSEKEAWSRELATFVESLAQLLEERWGRLEDVEKEWDEVLEKKTRLTQRVRAKEMEDELSLFWGVPGKSVLPPSKGKVQSADAMAEDEEESEAGPREEPSPVDDGDATSPLRTQRRENGPVPANQSAAVLREVTLTPADAAGFIEAQSALQRRLDSLLENVKAPEFLWPAATIDDEGGKPHPSSVHSRFLEWRTRYPDDYAKTWGSLALAGVWEFWARKEVALSDLATLDVEGSACMGALYQYLEECGAVDETGEGGIGGSDEEVIGTLVNTSFVTRLLRLSTTAYDPWSSQQTAQAHRLLVSMADVLPRTSARFLSVVTALLEAFGEHIQRLQEVLCDATPALPPPGFHPLSIPARLAFTTRLVGGEGSLLGNLATFARVAKSGGQSSGEGAKQRAVLLLENLVDTLVSRIAWPLMRECGEAGGQRLARGVLELLVKRGVSVQVDLKARLEGLAAATT